jgi:hypothetical protein
MKTLFGDSVHVKGSTKHKTNVSHTINGLEFQLYFSILYLDRLETEGAVKWYISVEFHPLNHTATP